MNPDDAILAPSRHTITCDRDVVNARQHGRGIAADMGFARPDQALIATAISELARNIVTYAGQGEIELERISQKGRKGIRIVARDRGPGIADIEDAMTDGFSTGNSLGLGLPGTRRIVDEFDLSSNPGEGVLVTVTKWQ